MRLLHHPRFTRPDYHLTRKALGGDAWRVYWKVPTAGGGALPIDALLPETCAPRRVEEGLRKRQTAREIALVAFPLVPEMWELVAPSSTAGRPDQAGQLRDIPAPNTR